MTVLAYTEQSCANQTLKKAGALANVTLSSWLTTFAFRHHDQNKEEIESTHSGFLICLESPHS